MIVFLDDGKARNYLRSFNRQFEIPSELQALNIVIPRYIYIVSWFTKSARDLTRWSWIESLLDSYEK